MANRVISIEMGYSVTKICEMDYHVKNPKVYQSFVLETPQGVLEDGTIVLQDDFLEECREALAERKIKAKNMIATVNSSKIATREVTIPLVKENKIANIVKSNAMDYFPIDVSKYQFAHHILGTEADNKGNQQYKLLVLAVPNPLINSYKEFAKALGMNLTALDYTGNSVFQAVKEQCKQGTQLIIKIDERSTLVTILRDANVVLTRMVGYGIEDVYHLLQSSEPSGEEMSYLDAIALSEHTLCINPWISMPEHSHPEMEEEDAIKKRQEATAAFSYIIGGISRIMDYYNSQNQAYPIEQINLFGMGSNFMGLEQLLSNEIGSQINAIHKIEGVSFDKKATEEDHGLYLTCIGATFAPIDLLSGLKEKKTLIKGEKTETKEEHFARMSHLILVGCILVSLIMTVLCVVPYLIQRKQQSDLTTRTLELKPVEAMYQEYSTYKKQYEELKELHVLTKNHNEGLLAFLTEMETKIPTNTALLNLDATTDSIRMEMTADTKESVAQTLTMLKTFDSVSYVALDAVTKQSLDTGEEKQVFTVTVYYKTYLADDAEETTQADDADETTQAEE
ncbi:MAG: pilus assembly protein PilM [Lachnospiraceae bacterium]